MIEDFDPSVRIWCTTFKRFPGEGWWDNAIGLGGERFNSSCSASHRVWMSRDKITNIEQLTFPPVTTRRPSRGRVRRCRTEQCGREMPCSVHHRA